jgi:hypothetical protein
LPRDRHGWSILLRLAAAAGVEVEDPLLAVPLAATGVSRDIVGGVGPGESENADPEESEDVLAFTNATGPLHFAPDGRTLRVQAIAEHLDQIFYRRAEAWRPIQVLWLQGLEPGLLLDVAEGCRELDDAVLDGRESPLPAILAVGDGKLLRPGAELGNPRLVDLLAENARVGQGGNIGNDMLQAIFDRLPADFLRR